MKTTSRNNNADLAGQEHWSGIYSGSGVPEKPWKPRHYDALALEDALLGEIARRKPTSIMEIGCGNSCWLPHLANKCKIATVAGMDYSKKGCDLSQALLEQHGVEGRVFCEDLFTADPGTIGTYDFIYSIGVVEHFEDLEGTLKAMGRFLRPGGVLFVDVPNLWSIHGLLGWIWQPKLLAKHNIVRRKPLALAMQLSGYADVRTRFAGVFALTVVDWPNYSRWPKIAPFVAKCMGYVNAVFSRVLRVTNIYSGIWPLAPFLIAVGRNGQRK